jgi:hypothetical protein
MMHLLEVQKDGAKIEKQGFRLKAATYTVFVSSVIG